MASARARLARVWLNDRSAGASACCCSCSSSCCCGCCLPGDGSGAAGMPVPFAAKGSMWAGRGGGAGALTDGVLADGAAAGTGAALPAATAARLKTVCTGPSGAGAGSAAAGLCAAVSEKYGESGREMEFVVSMVGIDKGRALRRLQLVW